MSVIKSVPGEAGRGKIFEERFMPPRSLNARLNICEGKQRQGMADMNGRSAAEGIRVEIAGDNCGTLAQTAKQKTYLNAAAAGGTKNLQMDIGYCQHAA